MSLNLGHTRETRSVAAADVAREEIPELVAWVVAGGRLLVHGREGRLLAALHLMPGGEAVHGPVEACAPDLDPVAATTASPVSGVGYALYRIDGTCVALGGPRGRGVVAYIGAADPPADLVAACLGWISRHPAGDFRFH